MAIRSLESTVVHARAQHCSPPVVDRGQQVVRFEGASYVMVGIYFARSHALGASQNGHRELYYILRPLSRDGDVEPNA
ncbi:MAG: hypothetical protein QN141_11205 [Armatimonadota bacterium]|nr:hypothetical protein [Armatimonadota bacterium]MDR7452274.1 hypothetical protein [Armatimonadota bacterium]MDR7467962.1 hypothetical protein [Armatimonadota bacterium]MDR7494804.1 hypothetical protein [Armatimonadota bacterium]MDR7505066.1 hypothetical protein [Armatimonadota bacterium]